MLMDPRTNVYCLLQQKGTGMSVIVKGIPASQGKAKAKAEVNADKGTVNPVS